MKYKTRCIQTLSNLPLLMYNRCVGSMRDSESVAVAALQHFCFDVSNGGQYNLSCVLRMCQKRRWIAKKQG